MPQQNPSDLTPQERRLFGVRPTGTNRIPTAVTWRQLPVIAAMPASSADDDRVYVIAIDPDRARRPYVVFTTHWTGSQWVAENGHYDLAMSDALGVLFERLGWPTAADHEDARLAQAGTERQYNRLRSAVYRAIDGLDSTQPDVDQVLDALRRALDA
jgi:hypothetical protein